MSAARARRATGLLVAVSLFAGGCGGGKDPVQQPCRDDTGCPAGYHCLVGTAVCVAFTTPLSPDLGVTTDLAASLDADRPDAGEGG